MAKFLDVARFTPTAGGTTDWTVSAAVTGYQTPVAAGAVDGINYRYRAESSDLSQWEIGYGVASSTGTVFARTTVLYNSSGTTSKINFSSAPTVGIVPLSIDFREKLDAARTYYVSTTGSNSNTGLATTTATITFTNGSTSVGWTSHGKSVGDNFYVTTTGALPTNFALLQIYYVKTVVDANTITVATTSGGSAVSAGSAGSGTHTANAFSPFLTIQKAVDTIATIDIAAQTVTVWIADGTYTTAVTLKNAVGYSAVGNLVIQGNNATPANVVVSTTSSDAISADGIQSVWDIKDLKIQTTTTGVGLHANNKSTIRHGNTNYGACANQQIRAENNATIVTISNYAVSGASGYHWYTVNGGTITASTYTVTITGTPAFSGAWALANVLCNIGCFSMTFTGSATGPRYTVQNASVIFTNGGGTTYLPGNTAHGTPGTTTAASPYGLYL